MQGTIRFTHQELPYIVDMLFIFTRNNPIITLTGPLGVGKTTLVQSLLQRYGIEELVVSPTFTYLNVYKGKGRTIYHFDLYRINTLEEFQLAGFQEYLYAPDSLTIIEWPEIIMPLVSQGCHVTLAYTHTTNERTITWNLV